MAINTYANDSHPQSLILTPEQLQREIQFSQKVSQQLAKQLKQRLMAAVKEGGLNAGIEQCKIAAPDISQQLIANYPEKLINAGRVSLKNRNPKNQPSDWQAGRLQKFNELNAKGQLPGFQYRLFKQEGKAGLEFISPISTQGLCLNCHGKTLSEPLSQQLNNLYPHDKATGYNVGDIRGAFVIRSWLDSQSAK